MGTLPAEKLMLPTTGASRRRRMPPLCTYPPWLAATAAALVAGAPGAAGAPAPFGACSTVKLGWKLTVGRKAAKARFLAISAWR